MNWIIVTIIAAFFQNLRSSFQKKINKDVSTIASTYVRFSFALPLALLLFFLYFGEFVIIKDILIGSHKYINIRYIRISLPIIDRDNFWFPRADSKDG